MTTTTVPLPFIPTVLAWSEHSRYLIAGGNQFLFQAGTDGLAAINADTGDVKWREDGVSCVDAWVAGSVAVIAAATSLAPGPGDVSTLEARDLITGQPIWRRTDIEPTLWSLAVDRAGRLLAVTTADGFRILDLASGGDIAQVALAPALGLRAAFAPSGGQLALLYRDGANTGVTVCEAATGVIRHQTVFQTAPLAAGFDDAGHTLTAVEVSGSVTVLDAGSGTLISRIALQGPGGPPALRLSVGGPSVVLSPDRRIVLTVEQTGYHLYATQTGTHLGSVPGFLNVATRAAYSPTARAAVVADVLPSPATPNDIVALSAPRPRVLWQQNLPRAPAAAFSPSGRLAVAQQVPTPVGTPLSGAVLIGVTEDPCLLSVTAAEPPGGAVLGVALTSQAHGFVAASCADQAVRLFGVPDGQLKSEHKHPGPVNGLVLLPDGSGVLTASSDGQLRLLDAATGAPRWSQRFAGSVNVLGQATSGAFVCAAGGDKTVRCFDTATGTQRWQVTVPQNVTRMTVSPDGGFVITACADRTVRRLSTTDGTQAWHLQQAARVRDLAISPDGTLVAAAGQDGTVAVLAAGSGASRRQVSHAQGATSVAFSADGHDIVSGSLDGAVLISPATDPAAPPAELPWAAGPIARIRTGPGRSVAVIAGDRLIRLIDLDLRAELARIYASDAVGDLAVDGTMIASGAADGTLRVDTWGN